MPLASIANHNVGRSSHANRPNGHRHACHLVIPLANGFRGGQTAPSLNRRTDGRWAATLLSIRRFNFELDHLRAVCAIGRVVPGRWAGDAYWPQKGLTSTVPISATG
jgi:hypothetical protein